MSLLVKRHRLTISHWNDIFHSFHTERVCPSETMNPLLQVFKNLSIGRSTIVPKTLAVLGTPSARWYQTPQTTDEPLPKPGGGPQYRRYVLFVCRGYVICFSCYSRTNSLKNSNI